MNNNRIHSLDSLRGIAAMIVVVFHCLLSYTIFYKANHNHFANDWLKYFTITPLHTFWAGREAVILFFVLSGFVLSIPFFQGTIQSYRSYAIRRFFRIYMPYIVVMMISVGLVYAFAGYNTNLGLSKAYLNRWEHEVSWKAMISYIFMIDYDTTNVNGVVWTLFHEMRISLILPLFLWMIRKFNFTKALLLSLGLNGLLYVIAIQVENSIQLLHNENLSSMMHSLSLSIYYCTFFILGAVLSRYRGHIVSLKASSRLTKITLLIESFVLINCQWIAVKYQIEDDRITDLISASGILLLFIIVLTSNTCYKLLTTRPLLWLGKVSFSLYLVHIPVLMMVTIFIAKLMPVAFAFMLVPFISMLVAHFSYKYLEVPMNNLGKSLSQTRIKKRLRDSNPSVPMDR